MTTTTSITTYKSLWINLIWVWLRTCNELSSLLGNLYKIWTHTSRFMPHRVSSALTTQPLTDSCIHNNHKATPICISCLLILNEAVSDSHLLLSVMCFFHLQKGGIRLPPQSPNTTRMDLCQQEAIWGESKARELLKNCPFSTLWL